MSHKGDNERRLRQLFEDRNALLRCRSTDDVLSAGLSIVFAQIQPQSAAIFLFDKHGRLARRAFLGINKSGEAVTNEWYSDENYAAGESFTGRAVIPAPGSPYGRLQWAENLDREQLKPLSRKRYGETFGKLRCALAVPLNGIHRTYGVLEVINKRLSTGQLASFSKDDLYRLSICSMNIATAISGLRRRDDLRMFSELTQTLLQPFAPDFDLIAATRHVTSYLTGPTASYAAVLVRKGSSADQLEELVRHGDNIDWSDWDKHGNDYDQRQIEHVVNTGEPFTTSNIPSDVIAETPWLRANEITAYACYPIKVAAKIVGTVSLFAQFAHEFYGSDRQQLVNVVGLLGILLESTRVLQELTAFEEDLQTERESLHSEHQRVIYDRSGHEALHDFRNFLLLLRAALDDIDNASASRRSQLIREQIQRIEHKSRKIEDAFHASARAATDIDAVLQNLVKYYSRELRAQRNITFELEVDRNLPRLNVNESEVRAVIANLVSNAIRAVQRAARKQGLIRISSTTTEERNIRYLQITVEDNGVGIPRENLEKIFDEGFSTYPGGTGMGLFLARIILDGYGGDMDVQSQVGKGTIFHVRIPMRRLAV